MIPLPVGWAWVRCPSISLGLPRSYRPSHAPASAAGGHAAIFTFAPSSFVMLAMVSPHTPPPPTPKFTVNWAGLPRAVERTAVIWYVQGEALDGSESSVSAVTAAGRSPMSAALVVHGVMCAS